MAIKDGDTVVLNYEGKLENGEVFDSSDKQGQPLEFEIGSQKVVQGFEDAIKGMEKGQKKEFELTPEQGYGQHMPELVKEFPKSSLPEGHEPKVGMVLGLQSPDGQQFPAKITEVKDDSISLDLNHPLAGQKLTFNVEVVDVKPAEEKSSQDTTEESNQESNQDSEQTEEKTE